MNNTMLVRDILYIYDDVKNSESFGGLYKTDNYSLDTINKLLILPIDLLKSEIDKNPTITIGQLADTDYYIDIVEFIESLDIKGVTETNAVCELPIINNEFLVLTGLKFYELEDIVVGKLLEVYSKNDNLLGKAFIFQVDLKSKKAKLKLFLTEEGTPAYAVYDKWWSVSKPEVVWTKADLLLDNEVGVATLHVNYKENVGRIGRVIWKLYFAKKEENEFYLLAEGVDLTKPGLIFIQKNNALFDVGKYKLSIIDKRKNITMPSSFEKTWIIDTPTSKLDYYVT
jgi:hypothetical protein